MFMDENKKKRLFNVGVKYNYSLLYNIIDIKY